MTRHRFGGFVLDDETVEIIGVDGVREVEPQVFDVLRYLVEQHGRLVTKEELLDNVWGDRFVSESALTTRIKQARRALDDDGSTQWAIKTVHGRGYRFVPEVSTDESDDPEVIESPAADLPIELRADTRHRFLGRLEELAAARSILERADTTEGFGWLWILGEPGIGKTRLAAEVADLARTRGHQVLFGRNSEDLRVPYQPFIEILRTADSDTIPADLEPLVPSDSASDATYRSALDDETRRYRMFEAVAEWFLARAASGPVTMIIDDAHWAADSTLQLLAHLRGRTGGGPVTFVLTSRDTAPDDNPRVADLIAAGAGDSTTSVVRLAGLDGDDAVRLVGADVDLDQVMRQTAGNPLFLQAVNPSDGSVDMASAVRRRLASLDEQVQETLRVGSVLGLEFQLRVAAAATQRDDLDILDDLEMAVAARLLDDVGQDRFRFAHALVRSSLREELSSSRQARIHRRIAAAVHDVFGDDPRHLPALAFHTAEASLADRSLAPVAVDRLRRAAVESSAQFSFEEATVLLSRARELVDRDDVDLAARLTLEQGIAESRAGHNMTAGHTFRAALAAADQSSDVELQIEAAIRVEDASWRPGLAGDSALAVLEDASRRLDQALAAGADIPDETGFRARLAVGRLRALAMSGRPDEAATALDEALDIAASIGSADIEANALSVYLGQVALTQLGSGSSRMVRRLAELEPDITDNDIALHAMHDRILHATINSRHDERRALVARMDTLQTKSHSRFWEFIRTNQEAMEAFYVGDLAKAEALAVQCRDLADALPEEDGSGTFGLRMFLIRREQDRLSTMAPLVRHVLHQADDTMIWTPGLALLLAETGAPDEAAEALRSLRTGGFDFPLDAMWSTVMVLLIDTMVELGDVEACTLLRSRFRRHAGVNVTMGSGLVCFGRADRYLGKLSFVIGDLETADEELGIALEADDAGGSVLWRNESRLWLARVRRARGHDAEADAMLDVVRREAAAAGLPRLERLAGEALT